MPKPFGEYPGSAMHTHMSLFEGEVKAVIELASVKERLRRLEAIANGVEL